MTNIQMVQKEVDGIEFYVSIDGKQSGMSVRGLARMAGVALSTIQKLLLRVNSPTDKDVPENLQRFIGKVFELSDVTASSEGAKNAQVIPTNKDTSKPSETLLSRD